MSKEFFIYSSRRFYGVIYTLKDVIDCLVYTRILYTKYQGERIWLFCERGVDAGDNGYYFYKFIRENYPDIAAYYVIKKTSDNTREYEKVSQLGNIVEMGSRQHKKLYLKADFLISAHFRWPIEPWRSRVLRIIYPSWNLKKFVFLQHGIIKDDVSDLLHRDVMPVDMFVCSADAECAYLKKTLGYEADVFRCTGLARYDSLVKRELSSDQILIMPTWRRYITNSQDRMLQQNFKETSFYKEFATLLGNKDFMSVARSKGMKVIFYLHHEMQHLRRYFDIFANDVVIIARSSEYEVHDLLRDSQLLITDYSSVFFDFAYMRKPLIYFQFDQEEFTENHWKSGYFDFERDGFGSVITDCKKLVGTVEDIVKEDFAQGDIYEGRTKDFFAFTDRGNCQRIYDAILSIQNEKINQNKEDLESR